VTCWSLIKDDEFQVCSSSLVLTGHMRKLHPERSVQRTAATMPLTSLDFTLLLYILSRLVTIQCYTYQTKPLFLSFSELAALEADSSHETNKAHFGDPVVDLKVKTFAVKCHEEAVEVVMKAYLFDPARRPVEPAHLRLGPFSAVQDHCTAKMSATGEYVIRASLAECGGEVTVGEPPNNPNVTLV